MNSNQRIIKRLFDFILSFLALICFSWLIIILILLASIFTKSSGLFIQNRVGQSGKLFGALKIKTMINAQGVCNTITSSNDSRIYPFGRFLRRFKLDELPQLWNVLVGDMSLVGPRPDVPGYADRLEGEDRIILSVRPGITGPASLYFRDEEVLLSKQKNAKEYNDTVIWPQKIDINKKYVENWSFKMDLIYLIKTVFRNA